MVELCAGMRSVEEAQAVARQGLSRLTREDVDLMHGITDDEFPLINAALAYEAERRQHQWDAGRP
jgi:hypothetical protein